MIWTSQCPYSSLHTPESFKTISVAVMSSNSHAYFHDTFQDTFNIHSTSRSIAICSNKGSFCFGHFDLTKCRALMISDTLGSTQESRKDPSSYALQTSFYALFRQEVNHSHSSPWSDSDLCPFYLVACLQQWDCRYGKGRDDVIFFCSL